MTNENTLTKNAPLRTTSKSSTKSLKNKAQKIVESKAFQNTIITLIIINAIILGAETSSTIMERWGKILLFTDSIILSIFVVELLLKGFAQRWKFFKKPWNVFDLAIVLIALVPATQTFSALRTLRILRVLKLLSAVPTMRKVIEGLLSAIPGIISVSSIMALFFYVFAVIGTHLYGQTFPQWFGTLGETMFTLFQIMTLESWSMGIVRPVMEEHPSAWAFFITYILVTTFTMLNLFIAIIVNAMHESADESAEEDREEIKQEIIAAIEKVEEKLTQKQST